MSDIHPDLEALSASLDGEDEKVVRAHVAGCSACRSQVDGLRAARDAVARPVAPVPSDLRERAIAAALDAAVTGPVTGPVAGPVAGSVTAEPVEPAPAPAPVPLRRSAPSWRTWLVGSAAAAVLAVVVATVALLGRGSERGDDTALSAGSAQDEKATADAGSAGPGAGDTAVDGGDLGEVPDVATLRSRLPRYGVSVVAPSAAAGSSAATESNRNAQLAVPPVAPPRQIGTRVCEIEARTARPELGVVVYFANARVGGTPAVVLGFAPSAGLPPATILVLAPQERCRLLGETTPP